MPLVVYSDNAIARARDGALEWLENNTDGWPRSWEQEAKNDLLRDYMMYDDFEAPPIAGYDALEREGKVERLEIKLAEGNQQRVHFRLVK